ncbi:MAG: enoyl-CoA hydratase/isomerase family protein [Candidatus Helarchaeota archaeon]
MMYETIILEKEDNFCILIFNRPHRKNAISGLMFEEIKDALDIIENDAEIRAAIITGAGDAFSSGGDFKIDYSEAEEGKEIDVSQKGLVLKLINIDKPIIAAVNGLALGAGMNIALNCDLIYASEKAEFGTFFIKRAIIPEMSSTYLLPRILGIHKAKELIFFGDKFSAQKAKEIGLINDVFPDEDFLPKVKEIAKRLANGPTFAIGLAKRSINSLLMDKIKQALETEAENLFKTFDSEDFIESLLSFMEKREPKYKGK